MFHSIIKKIILLLTLCLSLSINAQTIIYADTFGICASNFPFGWTSSSADWYVDQGTTCSGSIPSCTLPVSSGNSMMVGSDFSTSLEESVSKSFSTIGYSSLTLKWNGLRSTGAPLMSVSMSTNNITWTIIPFTDVVTDNAWHSISPISVPAAFDNKSAVYIKWSYTGTGIGNYIAIDDIEVSSTCTSASTPTLSITSTTICSGTTLTISITSGTLNTNSNWSWWTGSCSTTTSTSIGTGTSIVVSPTVNTNYYVRGTGGCGGFGNCKSASVIVKLPATISNAGPPQTVCITSPSVTMSANQPAFNSGTGTWSLVSGSGVITNTLSRNTTITSLGLGTNVFAWTISNSPCASSTSTVAIYVNNVPSTSNAGPSQTVCPNSSSITTAANTPAIGSGAWTLVSGSGSITNSLSPVTTITGLAAGANVFAWTISNPPCAPSVSNLTVTVVTASLNLGSALNLSCRQRQFINATSNPPGPISVSWSPTVGLSNPSVLTPTAIGTGSNIQYTVTANLSNGCSSIPATLNIFAAPVVTPALCFVTVDSLGVNNEIYWDKTLYPNADSFFVYREVTASVYKKIASLPRTVLSMYTDTNRTIGPANGDPNLTAYKYKLQYRDSCGAYSPLSLWHQTIFIQDQLNGNFNWTQYTIEPLTYPVSLYTLKRRNLATGTETIVLNTTSTVGTDPSYNLFWPTNTKWFVDYIGFSCNVTAKIPNGTLVLKSKTKSNQSNDKQFATGINKSDLINNISVYPNPAKDVIYIDLNNSPKSEISIELQNSLGQVVYQNKSSNQNVTVNTSEISSGVYLLHIKQDNKIITVKKIVINK